MARVVDQKLTLAVGKKSSTTGKCNFQARIFKHWELERTTPTISLMHFFKTFVYSDTLQTFLSHLHNLFRVRRPSSAPYLKPLSNDWHSVGIDGLNCGQRLLEGIDRQNLDISDADFYLGVCLSESLNNFYFSEGTI